MANYISWSTHIINDKVADEFHKTINVTAIVGSNSSTINHNFDMVFIGLFDPKG